MLGIDVDRYYVLYFTDDGRDLVPESVGFKAWADEHADEIGAATVLRPLDESLTRWEVEEAALDEAGQPIVDLDTGDFVMRTRVITTTPGRPTWLVDLHRAVEQ